MGRGGGLEIPLPLFETIFSFAFHLVSLDLSFLTCDTHVVTYLHDGEDALQGT